MFTSFHYSRLPNTADLGTDEKAAVYWKTAVKGVIYNQEKTYLRLQENQRR